MVVESELPEAGAPVAGGFVMLPRAVQKMVMNSPMLAGRERAPETLPCGAANVGRLELAIWMAPCPPLPGGMVNIPGETGPSGTDCGALVCPLTVTCTVADVAPASS